MSDEEIWKRLNSQETRLISDEEASRLATRILEREEVLKTERYGEPFIAPSKIEALKRKFGK